MDVERQEIAIVELSPSHEECIYTQVSFLVDSGCNVTLFIHPNIDKQIESYKHLCKKIETVNFDLIKGVKKNRLEYKIVKLLKHFDKVIFNTASSSKSLRNITFIMNWYKTECIGIIHNVLKLNKSFTQKIISIKIKKYFTLSDHLKNNIKLKDDSIKLESFYPIFFPNYEKTVLKKTNKEIWICIPGRVEYQRRRYTFLIETLKKNQLSKLIKFIILGNINSGDGNSLRQKIHKENLQHYFIFFDKFISNQRYYNYIDNSDFILPLLQKDDNAYETNKISGCFNLAYGFKKTLLCSNFYKKIPDLLENGLFYDEDNFVDFLNNLEDKHKKVDNYNADKWNYEFQKKKYLDFIFSK